MRRDRDEAMNLFDWVPALGMTMDRVLMPVETRLDDDRLFQAVQADVARRRPRTLMDGRPSRSSCGCWWSSLGLDGATRRRRVRSVLVWCGGSAAGSMRRRGLMRRR
jgi:hypothetical protein